MAGGGLTDTAKLKRRVAELSQAVHAEPGSVPRRLELAATLRDLGRGGEAIEIYRGVAMRYAGEGRFAQAIAVCRGILEIDPAHAQTQELLADMRGRARGRDDDEATQAGGPVPTGIPMIGLTDEPPTRIPSGDEPLLLPRRAAPDATDRVPRADTAELGEVTDPEHRPAVRFGITEPSLPPFDALLEQEEETKLAEAMALPLPPPPEAAEAPAPPPFPLLGELPRSAFIDLIGRLTVRRESPGTWLVREGEPGDACYLIAQGTVRVVKGGVEVARLGAGSFFGEFAMLADQRRHASVEVVEAVELLEITRPVLDQLVAQHPGVSRTLGRFYRERLLETLIHTAPFFAPLTAAEREQVAARFRPKRFGRGVRIIEEGQPGGGLYLVLVGEVEVVRATADGGGEVRLASLGEGSYFGEMSLLRGGVASATVRATRTTEAVQLPPRDFYDVASSHPVLWDALRTEAARRELLNHAILAGEARDSGDGIYLL